MTRIRVGDLNSRICQALSKRPVLDGTERVETLSELGIPNLDS